MIKFPLRRVVTGHDEQGRSKVLFDKVDGDITSRRPGHESYVVWTSEGFPVENENSDDESVRKVGTTLKDGTIFRIMKLEPGVTPRRHRSNSVDYLIVLSGAVTMELDDGQVTLNAGDTLVQRGTMHNWVVNGSEPCIMAVVLIDAKTVAVNGQPLYASG